VGSSSEETHPKFTLGGTLVHRSIRFALSALLTLAALAALVMSVSTDAIGPN
jgi:hypothetical protein